MQARTETSLARSLDLKALRIKLNPLNASRNLAFKQGKSGKGGVAFTLVNPPKCATLARPIEDSAPQIEERGSTGRARTPPGS
jgi:hypothetical protein